MKAFTKSASLLLALLLAVSLCACAKESEQPTLQPSKPPIVTGPTVPTEVGEQSITTQYLPAKVENPDDLPVLKWVCLVESWYGGRIETRTEAAMHEVNQMLADRNMPFRIQFVLLIMNQYVWDMDWFSTPEAQSALQGADLITANLSPEQMQTYLAPITAYAKGEASPSLENAVAHPYCWRDATVDGEIYAFPVMAGAYRSLGWEISTAALKDYGLSVEDFLGTFEEMDELFAEIYEQNGRLPFLYVSDGFAQGSYYDVPMICPGAMDLFLFDCMHLVASCFAIDYSVDSPRVVNYLEQDNIRNWQAACLRYQEAGYVTNSQQESTISYRACQASSVTTFIDATDTDNIEEKVQIPIMKPLFVDATDGAIVSGICADTGNMEAALKLLNLIAEDADFRLHLFYGKEGRDYTIEDGYYSITKTDGGYYCMDFISQLAYFCGLTTSPQAEDVATATDYYSAIAADGKTQLETFRESLDNSIRCCPVVFEFSGMDEELAAMRNIMREYFPRFSCLTADEYNQMLQELKDAGSEVIQAELQKQLDDWLAENPDWDSQ